MGWVLKGGVCGLSAALGEEAGLRGGAGPSAGFRIATPPTCAVITGGSGIDWGPREKMRGK